MTKASWKQFTFNFENKEQYEEVRKKAFEKHISIGEYLRLIIDYMLNMEV